VSTEPAAGQRLKVCSKKPLGHVALSDDLYPSSHEHPSLLKELSGLISYMDKIVGWEIQLVPKQ
jgi:hypothetical protein